MPGIRRRAEDQSVPVDRARVTRVLYARAAGLFVVGLLVGLAGRWLDARTGTGLLRLALANYLDDGAAPGAGPAVRAGLHPRPGDVRPANGPVAVAPGPSDDGRGAAR